MCLSSREHWMCLSKMCKREAAHKGPPAAGEGLPVLACRGCRHAWPGRVGTGNVPAPAQARLMGRAFHRVEGDRELFGDARVRRARGQRPQDFPLAGGQLLNQVRHCGSGVWRVRRERAGPLARRHIVVWSW